MKRIICILLVAAMGFSLVGCGTISSEKAIDIALEDLGINRIAAARTDAILDKTRDPAVYDVTIDRNNQIDYYVINAKTGEIISKESVDSNR